ncbi:unnamed protein product [Rotaria socialis]|uniref:USP domain-containing protein n=1 Tax=Rotaria socialis TaxID=392032 RepID=A0A817V005_9BILA|nr:unnamed protein product [Rotaria socialis]CAF4527029.1 unnamed protein product [Rotaria socialis]
MTSKDNSIHSPLLDDNNGQQPTESSDTNELQQQQQQQQQQQLPPDYITSTIQENEPASEDAAADDQSSIPMDDNSIYDENGQIKFPLNDLIKLEEQLNQTRWVVPVLPDGELIKCLRAAVRLATHKLDTKSDLCQRFIRDSLVNSFTKILCDEAVQTWKHEIFKYIYQNCMIFLELCVLKIEDDCLPLLEILGLVMNPSCRYHQSNHSRLSDFQLEADKEVFTSSNEYRLPQRGWLIDFINRFGDLGGFDKILTRFLSSDTKLAISVVVALLKPWGLCYEYLTQAMVKKYFAQIIEFVPQFLDQLTESDLKVETKTEPKSDTLSTVIRWLRYLASRIPDNEKECRNLDALRLKMILRILKTNSFSGKMNALNEVNKLIMSLNTIQRSPINRSDEPESLTAERLIQWIQENQVLDIVLRDCLHQPQYVEKLEKILRFIIKEQALSRTDLDKIWNSSYGKHEAIEKNVHDLLAKLAWDFSPEQLEHLFDCFRESWTKASKKQQEKLLELIRRLAEDDKEGLMANKVLELLWNIAHDQHLPNEIIDQALTAHLKILDYSCLQEKEKTKLLWLDKFMDEVKHDRGHVIISLKQLKEICMQFHEGVFAQNIPRMPGPQNRTGVIDILEKKYELTRVVTENLCQYMENTRKHKEEAKANTSPEDYYADGRFNHNQQIHERLNFLKFILKEGRLYLSAEHSKTIWICLAEEAVFPNDREQCFRWFAEIIDEDDFEPKAAKEFFQNHLMKLEAHFLTDLGMNCFDRFFKSVNAQLNKLQQKRRSIRLMNDEDLVGIEYLWKLILNGSDEVADRGIQLMREIYTNISPQLKADVKRIHESFISDCFDRLRPIYDSVKLMYTHQDTKQEYHHKLNSLIRILIVLREYLAECDNSYHKERTILPMSRAFRGRSMLLTIRVNTGQNRTDDFEHGFHSNDTWGHIRRFIHNRYKSSYGVIELYRNNEIIYTADDNKTLGQTDDRDRISVTARWVQHQTHGGSSGESSSSESEMNNNNNNNLTTAHHNRSLDCSDTSAETSLPSVIFSQTHEHYQFLIDIADLACKEGNTRLRDTARQILDLIPIDSYSTKTLNSCFTLLTANNEQPSAEECFNRLNKFYFHVSPSQMFYNLKATLINFLPAQIHQVCLQANNIVEGLHVRFLNAGGLSCLLNILSEKHCTDQCDISTRKSIYFIVLYLLKRLLIVLAIYQLRLTNSNSPSPFNESLEQILSITPTIPLPIMNVVGEQQHVSMSVEQKIAATLIAHRTDYPILKNSLLQYNHIRELIRLIWCLASSSKQNSLDINLKNDFIVIHQKFKHESFHPNENSTVNEDNEEDDESQLACREGLELLSISLALVPSSVENLLKENFFEYFFTDLILHCQYQIIRHTASEQIFLLTSRCSQGQCENLIQFFLQKQFQLLNKSSDNFKNYSLQSSDFFVLLCRLLSYAYSRNISPPNISQQLNDEISYLKQITLSVDDHLLRGHLNIAKELLQFQTSERKCYYGIDQLLIQQIIEQYLFPASTLLYNFRLLRRKRLSKQPLISTETSNNNDEDNELDLLREPPVAICQTPMSTLAAFDLLVVLGTNCIENLKLIDKYITDLFYTVPDSSLNEWDFAPLVGPRPNRGFVGLKNGGATCYMNSVLQQLFMIRSLRSALLSVKIPSGHGDEETDDDDQRRDTYDSFSEAKSFHKDNYGITSPSKQQELNNTIESSPKDTTNERNEYNIQIFRHIQRIFGHLLESKLQYYVPRGFWKIFKFSGEPVNLRDQHDAVEFLNTVVDSVDEALKILNLPQICSKVLGGTFADQKICKDCPHRYSREEDFTLLSVDIRHSQNLKESLEQYVIGELLDGPNAYFCEKCNKKVDTIKRTCFKKLPPILAIQLKRFDYDWERETPIKFNDYFEFPRELNMEPYTVQGLAKAEGMTVMDETTDDDPKLPTTNSNGDTRYKLVGIIVHSGQANGGHYYSFVQNKEELNSPDLPHWYKFDDTDVSDCKMDEDEELRSQCFGGDYPAQSFDQPVMKRQRRWWNAYILFYEKISNDESNPDNSLVNALTQLQLYDQTQRMPLSVQRSVRKQNIKFLHNRIHFSPEYFHFMKRLIQSNIQIIIGFHQQQHGDKTPVTNTIETIEELALVSVQIATKFLFSVGWRTKKALRGPAIDWTELIVHCIRWSRKARYYLAEEVLFKYPTRFQEYLIDCTSAEIRNAFGKMLVALANHSRQDEEITNIPTEDIKNYLTVEESILNHVLRLLKKEMPDNVKMLTQYFQFFVNYSSLGRHECEQLIRLNVPTLFVNLANDDNTSSSCSTLPRYGEPAKLFVILSTLIRCFDISIYCKPRQPETDLLPNPYYTHENSPICSMPEHMADIIFKRDVFIKKIIEDSGSCEESLRLLRFLVWENPDITSIVLNEIMTLLAMYHTYDFRGHLDVLYMILTIEDSWQEIRLLYVIKGIPMSNVNNSLTSATTTTTATTNSGYESTPQSLFDMFAKAKSTYQKKAYHCIKTFVQLFSNCPKAHHILKTDADIKQRWSQAVRWLHEQLERSYNNVPSNYPYYPSQGPVTSNDMSQGYFIERTQSARSLLDKAVELYPEMENDDVGSNSDDLEEDEPMENISPNVVIKNVASNISSKMTPIPRRPNSPSIVNSGSNQRISPAPTTPIQQNKTMHHHHPRS